MSCDHPGRPQVRASVWLFGGIAALTVLLFVPLCGALFHCGCVSLWAGGFAHCNVHAPSAPHCPVCHHHSLGASVAALTLAGQGLVFRVARRRGAQPWITALASVASLPFVFTVAGFLVWLTTDYPHFVARDARGHMGLPNGPFR